MAKRRGRGEGTIVQRRRWPVDGVGGSRLAGGPETTQSGVRPDAPRRRGQVDESAACGSGGRRVTGRTRDPRTIPRALARPQADTMRPRAWSTYEQAVRLYLVPGLGKLTLARLRPTHVDDWMRALQEKGTTARTIRYARVVLRAALNQARKWEIVNQNVAALVDPPRHTAKGIEPLTRCRLGRCWRSPGPIGSAGCSQLRPRSACGSVRAWGCAGATWTSRRGTLSVRQAIERSGGDSAARRPLVVSRRAIRETDRGGTEAERRTPAVARRARDAPRSMAEGPDDGSEPRSRSRRAAVGRSICRRSWSRR